ncbi:hypothetical protein DPMN_047042 [Dreissena polymorpha]|uniref:Uncharacterized protein n=1 Tax=Dreissena polymorpha TaxID=45954 RepID=A0A9D4D905_DREPO|nr:hypothetical protein DPMN_047042 [Dreissena polymorpha]
MDRQGQENRVMETGELGTHLTAAHKAEMEEDWLHLAKTSKRHHTAALTVESTGHETSRTL